MNSIEILRKLRSWLIEVIDRNDSERLHKIPDGFSNNLIWNIGHIVTAQEILCYSKCNMPLSIPESYPALFSKGTSPKDWDNHFTELKDLKSNLMATLSRLENDYVNNRFAPYQAYHTSMGVWLKSVDDAITYNVMHEGLHYGLIKKMEHMVK